MGKPCQPVLLVLVLPGQQQLLVVAVVVDGVGISVDGVLLLLARARGKHVVGRWVGLVRVVLLHKQAR